MFYVVFLRSEVVMYVVERHPNGTSRTVPATDVFTHLNQTNIKVTTGCMRRFFKGAVSPRFSGTWKSSDGFGINLTSH